MTEAEQQRTWSVRCLLQLRYGRLYAAAIEFNTTEAQLSRAIATGKGWVAARIASSLGVTVAELWDLTPYTDHPGDWWRHLDHVLTARDGEKR